MHGEGHAVAKAISEEELGCREDHVVFPNADVKVYLDASPEERVRRRALDAARQTTGDDAERLAVADALAARDSSDRTRTVSPLLRVDDAVYIDTTGLAIEDVVDRVMGLVMSRIRPE